MLAMSKPTIYDIHKINEKGLGEKIGTISLEESKAGLEINVDIKNLTPNSHHGFHVHENPSCEAKEKEGKMVAGLAAGGHYDPEQTKQHLGPMGHGHLGDLPELVTDSEGHIQQQIITQKLTFAQVKNRTFMVHAESDNYADKLGGARMACALIQ
jgi:Cu-Zn family superoxide dismutase